MAAYELNQTILKDSSALKAYYRFESGALTTDSSGQSKTLTNNNTATEGTGVYGGAVTVNGTNQSMSIADNLGIDGGAVTLSLWLKTTTVTSGADHLSFIALHSATSDVSYNISVGGIGLRASRLKTGVAWQDTSEKAIASGSWNHAVLTYDATNVRLYVNGEYIGSVAASGNGSDTGSSKLTIGCRADVDALTGHIAADIDDVAVFNVALSADQIKELYEGRYQGELRPGQFGTTAGLWHMNGNVTDVSGNNNHLTVVNTPTYATGKFGQGLDLESSSTQYAYIADTASLSISTYITIACWVKFESFSATENTFVSKYDSGQTSYLFCWNDTGNNLQFYANAVNVNIAWNPSLATWYHLAATYDSVANETKMYVNGSQQGATSTALTDVMADTTARLAIGAYFTSTTPGGLFDGLIDEVLIASTALTANQIRQMYAMGTGKLGRYA